MVYGRILYNNIKEYTPKWFPTIPYSQTTKPVFGISLSTQAVNPKSSPSGTPTPPSKVDGDSLDSCSTTVGHTKYSSSDLPSPCGPPSTTPFSPSIRPTIPTEVTKLPSLRKKPTRKSLERLKRLPKLPKEGLRSDSFSTGIILNHIKEWKTKKSYHKLAKNAEPSLPKTYQYYKFDCLGWIHDCFNNFIMTTQVEKKETIKIKEFEWYEVETKVR
jgi:hypothetical protein